MKKNKNIIDSAIEFAQIAHSGQKRKNGEDFINHSLRVKKYLERIGIKDEFTLAAAVLHACPKEGGIALSEITKEFGEEISYIVDLLTKASTPIYYQSNTDNVENLHKLIIHMAKDIRVLLIRLADRIDNIKTADTFSNEEQIWIAKSALNIYAPIAKAVGVYYFTRELEGAALKILEPKRYHQIDQFSQRHFKNTEQELVNAKNKIEKFLNTLGTSFDVKFRTKSIYSIHKKAHHKYNKGDISKDDSFHELYDLLGIMTLLQNEKDCYNLLAFIQENWKVVQNEFDDYIANPKPNGYRTLQTAIELAPGKYCEIQIKTFDMHNHNEFGPASHFSYKYGKTSSKSQSTWIKELIEQKEKINEMIAGESKIKAFQNTTFVFTPKGQLITLPENSTPVDFAFALHTDIGKGCSGALINGKMVSLNTPLSSGDTIEIQVSKKHTPSQDWLKFVKTAEAKRQIKKFTKKSLQ
ncbi:hypothetical protein CO058_03070 [candidate division WWE3 bacterium CG_4_9_14_0_2_um_filter_35_11]|uniref:TGS domain-containing protein n=1 Tax=candidate division WWE3 bacterium CG_4_9_14_0_2_um_filter_35_11 TaxID=1975077 RepID=A0A2M8ELA3_UNCKA|nr:MAG: hypothetical protein COV25_01505 [candidate division WWE3 bacterium CG10_big_fil_rev_8_21_14_0_10_35_32]PJC23511.1 MAG: hypothetical protein CO058_03070 [candidate division WWE3 bacterium CG_4_9_14_0_2_um_filter_35_11]